MRTPRKEIIERLREDFPVGCRVELLKMDDDQAPPVGTLGTVVGVDAIGTIHVDWDNGSHLGIVYGEDSCRKLNTVKTICYGREEVWDSREEALEFYMKAMAGSEGSEQERYAKVVAELAMGKAVCTDGEE